MKHATSIRRSAILLTLGMPLVSAVCLAQTPTYTLQKLGNIPGGTQAHVSGINNAGDAVGSVSGPGTACPIGCAVVWHNGTPTLLGPVAGATFTVAVSINNAGEVAGTAYTGQSPNYNEQAVVWNNGTPTLLSNPVPQSTVSYAAHINDTGAVVGAAFSSGNTATAIVWNGSTPTVLDLLPGYTYAEAAGINDNGLVVGNICCDSNGTYTGVVWHGTIPVLLPFFTQNSHSEPLAVDNSGLVVGQVNDHAGAWANGGVTEIESFNSTATAINNRGIIVGGGEIEPNGQQALIWGRVSAQPEQFHDLISAAAAKKVTLMAATGINDSCTVVANGYPKATKVDAAFVLTLINPYLCVNGL